MSKCIIIGAGASLGYDENLVNYIEKPPQTQDLFKNGHMLNLFNQIKYPKLYESLRSYQTIKLKWISPDLTKTFDAEEFLNWVGDNWESLVEKQKRTRLSTEEFDALRFFQTALGEAWYYILEIMKHYSLAYKTGSNNYERLAYLCKNKNYSVISLNYDTIFEQAILSSGGKYNYFSLTKGAIPIAKIHGSINWINPARGGIAFNELRKEQVFGCVTSIVFSNRIEVNSPLIKELSELPNLTTEKLLRSTTDYDIPIIVPPIGRFKPFADTDLLHEVRQFAQNLLIDLDELILIGTKLRPKDTILNSLVKNHVKKSTKIIIATRNQEEVKKNLSEVLGWNNTSIVVCDSFNDFVRKYIKD